MIFVLGILLIPSVFAAPTVNIMTQTQNVLSDSLILYWSDSDAVGVTERRYNIGSQPTDSVGTIASSGVSISGFSSGSNTVWVGARDAAGSWGYDSVVINYLPFITDIGSGLNSRGFWWTSFHNCNADWTNGQYPVPCPGVGMNGGWGVSGCGPGTRYEEIRDIFNYPGGVGGRGQGHFLGPSQTGGTGLQLGGLRNHVWIRFYHYLSDGTEGWPNLGSAEANTQWYWHKILYLFRSGASNYQISDKSTHALVTQYGDQQWRDVNVAPHGNVIGTMHGYGEWVAYEYEYDYANGIYRAWVNDELVSEHTGVGYGAVNSIDFIAVGENIHGTGSSPCFATLYDDIALATPNNNAWVYDSRGNPHIGMLGGSSSAACTDGQTRVCSTGEQGVCSSGIETCSGGAWGSCVRDTAPSSEICTGGLDEDCDGDVDCGDSGCSSHPSCQVAVCGNSAIETGEDCDDGNTVTEVCAYGVNTSCVVCDLNCLNAAGNLSYCGDGICDVTHEDNSTCVLDCNTNCIDLDTDGYGVGCSLGADCNDSNGAVHSSLSCSYDGSSCGAYSLCVASCPAAPAEVCGNGIDEDCSGSDLACSSGQTAYIFDDAFKSGVSVDVGNLIAPSGSNPYLGSQALEINAGGAWSNNRIRGIGIDVNDWSNATLRFYLQSDTDVSYLELNLWADGAQGSSVVLSHTGSASYTLYEIPLTDFVASGSTVEEVMFGSDFDLARIDELLIFEEGSCASVHEADTDCVSGVSFDEVASYLNRWLLGERTIGDFLGAVNFWKS